MHGRTVISATHTTSHLVHQDLAKLMELFQLGSRSSIDDGAYGIADTGVGLFSAAHVSITLSVDTHAS